MTNNNIVNIKGSPYIVLETLEEYYDRGKIYKVLDGNKIRWIVDFLFFADLDPDPIFKSQDFHSILAKYFHPKSKINGYIQIQINIKTRRWAKAYYLNSGSVIHKEDGPAIEGDLWENKYYLNNKEYSKEEYLEAIKNL